jgi:predicted phage tail protein
MPFFLVPFLIQLAVSVALMTLAYIIAPKPKQEKSEAQDLPEPKAEAGAPIPVVFGTKTVSGLNILWYGEKTTKKYEV